MQLFLLRWGWGRGRGDPKMQWPSKRKPFLVLRHPPLLSYNCVNQIHLREAWAVGVLQRLKNTEMNIMATIIMFCKTINLCPYTFPRIRDVWISTLGDDCVLIQYSWPRGGNLFIIIACSLPVFAIIPHLRSWRREGAMQREFHYHSFGHSSWIFIYMPPKIAGRVTFALSVMSLASKSRLCCGFFLNLR